MLHKTNDAKITIVPKDTLVNFIFDYFDCNGYDS
jgi:hypothetical protein